MFEVKKENQISFEEMHNEENILDGNIIITSNKEEKISPNAEFVKRTLCTKCNHIEKEYVEIPKDIINNVREEVEKKYPDWKIERFSEKQVALYIEKDELCSEHYVLRENSGVIVIYNLNREEQEILYSKTRNNNKIFTRYKSDRIKTRYKYIWKRESK